MFTSQKERPWLKEGRGLHFRAQSRAQGILTPHPRRALALKSPAILNSDQPCEISLDVVDTALILPPPPLTPSQKNEASCCQLCDA